MTNPPPGDRLSRRRFIEVAVGAIALGGAGCGVAIVSDTSTAGRHAGYRSAPGLNPPPRSVVVPPSSGESGLIFLTAARSPGYQHGPMIIEDSGELVWFAPQVHGSTNLQLQSFGGRPALTWWEGRVVKPGYGRGDYVIADSSYRELTRVHGGNGLMGDLHEFVLTAEDTALFTAYRPRPWDLSSVGGPRNGVLLDSYVQEVDVASGAVKFQWSAAEHVPLTESYVSPPGGSTAYDFFHLNSIDVDPDGDLLLSARHTWAVYKVSRPSGAIIWRLNGKRSDFKMGPKARFAYQHHARHHPGSLVTIFDDGAGPTAFERESRGIKVKLDTAARTAELVEAYLPDPSILATSQGSVQVLPSGEVFVGWGSEPYFSQYTSGARLLYDARFANGTNSYRAFRYPWVGRPATDPAVAVDRAGHDRADVFASWNGATEVRRWQVLAGPSSGALEPVGTFERQGFETKMRVRTAMSSFAVRALDGRGRVLGRSKVAIV